MELFMNVMDFHSLCTANCPSTSQLQTVPIGGLYIVGIENRLVGLGVVAVADDVAPPNSSLNRSSVSTAADDDDGDSTNNSSNRSLPAIRSRSSRRRFLLVDFLLLDILSALIGRDMNCNSIAINVIDFIVSTYIYNLRYEYINTSDAAASICTLSPM